ncbi:MAG TPA: GntR family transcriptional regulator [Streptosporangiaceae bacterium]|nr:GntR family transcriptional regulator [Streptosporangiaceae bacterium]
MSSGVTELDRPVPLYMQVVRQLRAQIAAGDLAEGDRLPSQREMMARWRISMQTASKVIGAMKTEGLAIPSVGRDTVVAPGAAARIAAAAQGTARAPAAGLPPAPGAAVTSASAGKAAVPAYVAEIVGIPAGRRALRRTETRGQDGQAASITVSWYPAAIADRAPRLAEPQALPAGTVAYIAEATGTRAARADEEYAAAPAGDDTAVALGIAPGSPVLVARVRLCAADGTLLEYAETTIPAGHWRTRTYTITSN